MSNVSIIMGVYNCALTLSEAIESLISQTFQDWELIVCDDGSDDNTYSIAEEYKKRLGKKMILFRNEENQGLNYTLNRCLEKSTGDYIARMDGDDISLPSRLEKEVHFLDNHLEYAIVSTPMIYFDENGIWGYGQAIEKPEKKDVVKHHPVFCHAPCMIRREAYLAVGGYTEHDRMVRCEDMNLWYKLYAKGYRGYNLQEPLYKMRDDFDAVHRRNMKTRMNVVYTMYIGFKLFQYPWYMYIYVVKELFLQLIKGMIPKSVYRKIHQSRIKKEV